MANRYALLIGNTDYEDPALRKLKAPEADVRTLAELLGAPDLGGYHVTTLLNQPKHEVEVAIGDLFADKHPDDLLLLYFTGHGVLDDPGRLYLAVISTRADRPKATGLSAAWLKTEMDDSRAFRQVLLLDCCHSGAFTSGGAKGAEGLNRPAILDDTFGEKGRGRVVLTATDKTSAAWEGEKIIGGLEHSLFTHFVIEGLRTGAAADEQGRVTSDSLYAYVFRAIVAATNKQRPRQIVYDREGEIVIARSPRPPAPQAAGLPAEVRQAIERAVFQDPRRATSEKTYFLESLKPNPDRLKLTAPFEMELIRIPAGEFRMGSANTDELADDEEKPQQTVFVSEFYMARTPVTVVQFAAFVKATGYKTTAEEKGSGWNWTGSIWKEIKGADWQHPRGPESSVAEKQAHPVTLVSWDDAVAFCRWLNETGVRALPAGWRFRLPTEAEWEKAARGTDGRLWPWGDAEPDDTRCNFGLNVGDTTPVGQYSPKGDSPYGCVDMAGNVCEWCLDGWDEKAYQNRKGIVQDPFNGGNPGTRVLRGGSWRNHHRHCRSAFRLRSDPDSFINQDIGFRVCASRIHLNH